MTWPQHEWHFQCRAPENPLWDELLALQSQYEATAGADLSRKGDSFQRSIRQEYDVFYLVESSSALGWGVPKKKRRVVRACHLRRRTKKAIIN